MPTFEPNKFMTVSEAALYLRVASATIYGWTHQRKIPFRKHGGRLILLRQHLDEWSEQQQISAHSEESFHRLENYVKPQTRLRKGRSLTIEQNGGQKAKSAEGGL